jgi:hypothetical protein
MMFPNALLNIAAASSPPAAFVRTVTEFVVEGRVEHIIMPLAIASESTPSDTKIVLTP